MSLVSYLEKGEVEITYISLNSGREITRMCTTNVGLMEMKQSPASAKIVVYDVVNKEWEDIETSTIIAWEPKYD